MTAMHISPAMCYFQVEMTSTFQDNEHEDPLKFPGDLREEWEKDDRKETGRKPRLDETEEDGVADLP